MSTLQTMFVGSMIVYEGRKLGFAYAQKTELGPSDMSDELPKALLTAIRAAEGQWNLDPTPDNLATIIIADGLLKPESSEPEALIVLHDTLVKKAIEYALLGANSTDAFSRIESMLHLKRQDELLKLFGSQVAPQIANNPIGSPVEKGEQLLEQIQKITSNWTPESSIYTLETQMKQTWDYLEERRQMIATGARLMTLPPELGRLQKLVPYIRKGIMYTVKGPTKGGKAQPLDAKVLTPKGWTTMGQIQVGDEVIGSNGRATKVIAIHPQGQKQIFKVSFSDGTSTRCCKDHLWTTKRKDQKQWTTRSLEQILEYGLQAANGDFYHYVRHVDPVDFDYTNLPIDPYLLGLLLGDGGLTSGTPVLTTADPAMAALPTGMVSRRSGRYGHRFSAIERKVRTKSELASQLSDMNLMGKGIPKQYLYAHIEARIAILQGLLDTDGHPHKTYVEYITTSEQLAKDVSELVRSLGGKTSTAIKYPTCIYKGERRTGKKAYRMVLTLPNEISPFRLERKLKKLKKRTLRASIRKSMISIEAVSVQEAKCITVAAEDGLYVTDDYIVTHNSSLMGQISEHLAKGAKVAYFAFEDNLPRKIFQQTCRLVPGSTFEHLERGDYENNIDKAFEIKQGWENNGGAWILIHCPGKTASWVVSVINRIQAQYGLDVVFVDYLQKITTTGQERWRGLSEAAELFKQRSEEPGKEIAMFVGSQVTVDAQGNTHSRECYDLEMKSQCVIGISRHKAKADEVFNGITLAHVDEQSVYTDLWVEYNNDGGTGKETVVNWKPRFMFTIPALLNSRPDQEVIPVLTRPSERELEYAIRVQNAYKAIGVAPAERMPF